MCVFSFLRIPSVGISFPTNLMLSFLVRLRFFLVLFSNALNAPYGTINCWMDVWMPRLLHATCLVVYATCNIRYGNLKNRFRPVY